jgi:hypothetical protein
MSTTMEGNVKTEASKKGYPLCPATGEPHEWILAFDGGVVCFRCGQLRCDIENEEESP